MSRQTDQMVLTFTELSAPDRLDVLKQICEYLDAPATEQARLQERLRARLAALGDAAEDLLGKGWKRS